MTELGITSIDEWIEFLGSFPSLAIISGFTPGDIPGIGTFYDFLKKLYLMDKDKSSAKGKTKFTRKPKAPLREPDYLLQTIFKKRFVIPSANSCFIIIAFFFLSSPCYVKAPALSKRN